MDTGNQSERLNDMRDIEAEITEALAVLGRWSYVFEKLRPGQKQKWKAVVARAQGSGDRAAVQMELDRFINATLKPFIERMD